MDATSKCYGCKSMIGPISIKHIDRDNLMRRQKSNKQHSCSKCSNKRDGKNKVTIIKIDTSNILSISWFLKENVQFTIESRMQVDNVRSNMQEESSFQSFSAKKQHFIYIRFYLRTI